MMNKVVILKIVKQYSSTKFSPIWSQKLNVIKFNEIWHSD